MSRVALLDSAALDNEIHSLFWKDFQSNFSLTSHQEELQLLIQTLVFLCGSKSRNKTCTYTYGSKLSGVYYKGTRRTLYLVTIIARYLESKLSSALFTSSEGIHQRKAFLVKLFQRCSAIYSVFDLYLFVKLLAKSSSFLSPLHRLMGVSSVLHANDTPTFYDNTVYSQVEFQNRQLLWNAILELFNATLLSNARLFGSRYVKKPVQDDGKSRSQTHCTYCSEFPTSPHRISCCNSIFCYVCVVKTLEWMHCPNCNATKSLSASPLY